MAKFSNSVLLIAGTAIGSGLISLPISAAKLGLSWTLVMTLIAFFIAYKTSCITIDLMKHQHDSMTIVELSHKISGRKAQIISMFSLYILSLSLLCVYFSGLNSILDQFLMCDTTLICLLLLTLCFIFKSNVFNTINSFMVFILLVLIAFIIFATLFSPSNIFFHIKLNYSSILMFCPIIFTSFGVQNVCPFIVKQMGIENTKEIKKTFLIGTSIPAIIYVLWVFIILNRVYKFDANLYNQMLTSNIDVGILINSLCKSAKVTTIVILLKFITIFAIVTSAIGIGIGLISSLGEIFKNKYKTVINILIVVIPALLIKLIPNAFMNILSFGGMIATIFVIFMPIYLNSKIKHPALKKIAATDIFTEIICILFGLAVICAELFNFLTILH